MPIPELASTFGKLLDQAPVGMALVDPPCRLIWANAAFFRELGLPPTLVGQDLRKHDAVREARWLPGVEQALTERRAAYERDLPVPTTRPKGGTAHADVWTWPLPGTDPERVHALVMVHSSEERLQDRLRARLFYESFLTSTNAMEVTDRNGVLIDVNPAFERIYGYSRAECIGKKPNLVRSKRTPLALYEKMWKDLLDPNVGHWSGEILNRDRRGHDRPVFLTITAVRDEGGEVTSYVGVAVDLAEQRKWELGAARAERMASLGQLAAGVAHEINTPLANIMLVAESITRRSKDPWMTSRAQSITSQVEVAAEIVRGLLDYSRRSEPHLVDQDLVRVVKDSVEFLRGKQTQEVEIETHYPSHPLLVSADRGQLMQVVTNVMNNAYDAMGGPGRVLIRLRQDGSDAELEISDSGPGIPAEALPRIFEPFFTTKEEGKGTGLGLAICQSIITAHHGTITAQNLLSGGASFLIRLPLREAAAGHPPPVPEEAESPPDPARP